MSTHVKEVSFQIGDDGAVTVTANGVDVSEWALLETYRALVENHAKNHSGILHACPRCRQGVITRAMYSGFERVRKEIEAAEIGK